MSENNDQGSPELLCCKFNASNLGGSHNVARNANDEEVTKTLIENNLCRDPGIRASENYGKWFLPTHQLIAAGFIDKALGLAIPLYKSPVSCL
jgi:hypothetical protein